MKLLVCIASHNPEDRLLYLSDVINTLKDYKIDTTIIIDSNKPFSIEGAEVVVQESLPHPYSLTWCHRKHIADNLYNYDWFMYTEDDMKIPYKNFLMYTENFSLLWDRYIPSFVRIEEFQGKKYITDVTTYHNKNDIISLHGKRFIHLSNPYHAFWIMPRQALVKTLTASFTRLDTWRELAASYPMWELKKTPLVMIENDKISPLCYSYHLPNNYAMFPNTSFGKIQIDNLICP